jgi:hypothetical protein
MYNAQDWHQASISGLGTKRFIFARETGGQSQFLREMLPIGMPWCWWRACMELGRLLVNGIREFLDRWSHMTTWVTRQSTMQNDVHEMGRIRLHYVWFVRWWHDICIDITDSVKLNKRFMKEYFQDFENTGGDFITSFLGLEVEQDKEKYWCCVFDYISSITWGWFDLLHLRKSQHQYFPQIALSANISSMQHAGPSITTWNPRIIRDSSDKPQPRRV